MRKTNKPETIIIIDDDDDEAFIRLIFADYLQDRNFEIVTAINGRIGLELIEKKQPDMILVDLYMWEIDGFEVLKQARKSAPDTPKIIISGANRIGDVVPALRYGAWDYFVKPVKGLSILEHTVNKTMVQERTYELETANTRLASINDRLRSIVETTQGLSACIKINQFSIKILDEFAHHMAASGGSIYFVEEREALLASYSCETLKAIQAFEKVQESEKLYRTLFEKTDDAIFIVEKNTSKCLDGNVAAARLTGRTLQELKNMNCKDIVPENADERLQIFINLYAAEEMALKISIKKYVQKPITGQELSIPIRELLDA